MNMSAIIDAIQKTEGEYSEDQIKKIQYVADNDKHTCQECSDNDGNIFDIDDDDLPQLPIHPSCRCKYVSITAPNKDVSEDVERYRIVKNLKETWGLEEKSAKSLAQQVIDARHENSKLREQRLFLLFNGRYLMSSNGKLLLDAVSGQPVSEKTTVNRKTMFGGNETVEREFDYSYSRQGIRNKGGIPVGLYHIKAKEERSAKTSPWTHIVKSSGWGNYAWTLHPDEDTDIRQRDGFFIHGGLDFGSAGCIDLQEGDTNFQKYFVSTRLSSIYVYVKYDKERVTIREQRPKVYSSPSLYMP